MATALVVEWHSLFSHHDGDKESRGSHSIWDSHAHSSMEIFDLNEQNINRSRRSSSALNDKDLWGNSNFLKKKQMYLFVCMKNRSAHLIRCILQCNGWYEMWQEAEIKIFIHSLTTKLLGLRCIISHDLTDGIIWTMRGKLLHTYT